jgi:threonine synthase
MYSKVGQGFGELLELGLVEGSVPRIYGGQAEGCAPVACALAEDRRVTPVRPNSVARSLAIGNPADGPYVLDAVRRTGGAIGHVSDDEVRDGIQLLARTEGVFAETAGGVTVATEKKLIEAGKIDPDAETVLLITGDGLKTLDAVADRVGPTATVASSSKAVKEALAGRG